MLYISGGRKTLKLILDPKFLYSLESCHMRFCSIYCYRTDEGNYMCTYSERVMMKRVMDSRRSLEVNLKFKYSTFSFRD